MNPPSNIVDIYKSQGWNDEASIQADIANGGWKSKVGSSGGSSNSDGGSVDLNVPSIAEYTDKAYAPADEALKAYVMALRGQKNPLDVYNELETAAGLPEMKQTASTLRGQIGSLEDTIRRVEGDVSATTKESLVTEAQRRGMVTAKQTPLMENLSTLTTGLGRIEQGISSASSDIGTKTGLFVQGQEAALKPYEVQVTALQDRAARLVSGFTADTQNTLTTLMAKYNRSNELDDKEVDQAFELLKLEKNYNNEIEKMKQQSTVDLAEYKAKKGIDNSSSGTPSNVNSYYDSSSTPGISDLWNAVG